MQTLRLRSRRTSLALVCIKEFREPVKAHPEVPRDPAGCLQGRTPPAIEQEADVPRGIARSPRDLPEARILINSGSAGQPVPLSPGGWGVGAILGCGDRTTRFSGGRLSGHNREYMGDVTGCQYRTPDFMDLLRGSFKEGRMRDE